MEGATFGSVSYFQAADYAIFVVIMAASLAIGLYYGLSGGRQRTSAEYVLANRSMTFVPVTLSLLSSFFSGISMQGKSADVYYHGPLIIWVTVPITLGGILALTFFMPMYYRIGVASAYDYLGMRFNDLVKICGVISFLLFAFLYMGLVIYTACVAATTVADVSVEVAIIFFCIVCAIYTVIGGIKAVLWTDSLQMLLMIATIVSVVIKGAVDIGFERIWETAAKGMRTDFFRFHTDLTDFYNGWGFILGQITLSNFMINNQYMVQRMVVCKSEAVARASIIGYMVGMFVMHCLLVLAGMTMYAYYEGCEPTTLGYITKNDQILPYFVIDVFSHLPGIPGLLLTGLFGAALSTMSSVLNAIATLIGEHFVKPFRREMTDSTYTFILKVLVIVASTSTLGIAFLIPAIGDAIAVSMTISGASQGTLLALYILGAFFPFCGAKNALAGYVVGLLFGVVMSIGVIVYQVRPDNLALSAEMCINETTAYLYNETTTATDVTSLISNVTQAVIVADSYRPAIFTLSKIWLAFFTFLTTLAVALLSTLITGANDTSNMDPRLVIWKIKSSFRVETGEHKVGGNKYSVIPQMDQVGKETIPDSVITELGVRQVNNCDKTAIDNEQTDAV